MRTIECSGEEGGICMSQSEEKPKATKIGEGIGDPPDVPQAPTKIGEGIGDPPDVPQAPTKIGEGIGDPPDEK